jgi:hypothetical protein
MEPIGVRQKDLKTGWRWFGPIVAVPLVVIALVVTYFALKFQPEKNAIHRMFRAIEAKQFDQAYGIYQADPDWQQHPERYMYTYNQFYLDWGYSDDFGVITSHEIECAMVPKAGSAQAGDRGDCCSQDQQPCGRYQILLGK